MQYTGSASSVSNASTLGMACLNAALGQGNMRHPTQAIREGIKGEIKNLTIINGSNRIFINVVTEAAQQFGCRGQGQDAMVETPFTFRLNSKSKRGSRHQRAVRDINCSRASPTEGLVLHAVETCKLIKHARQGLSI